MVLGKRLHSIGGVAVAGGVGVERIHTIGGVAVAGGVGVERIQSIGGVLVACGVGVERLHSIGGVVVARGVGVETSLHWRCCSSLWCWLTTLDSQPPYCMNPRMPVAVLPIVKLPAFSPTKVLYPVVVTVPLFP